MFNLIKRPKPTEFEAYEVSYTEQGGFSARYCRMSLQNQLPSVGVEDFLKEMENGYWLNLEEFEHELLPVNHEVNCPLGWSVRFGVWNFSTLTKIYLVLKADGGCNIHHCDQLLGAVAATMGSHLKHVPKKAKKKVLSILNSELFYWLDENAMGNSYWIMEGMIEQTA